MIYIVAAIIGSYLLGIISGGWLRGWIMKEVAKVEETIKNELLRVEANLRNEYSKVKGKL